MGGSFGKSRSVGAAIVLSIVTLGIYYFIWLYKSFSEIKRWRGQGISGGLAVVLSLVTLGFFGVFLLPSYVGRMYKEAFIARGEDPLTAAQKVPITGWSGFLHLIPWIGSFIWMAKVQSKLNNFWEGQQYSAPATAGVTAAT